MRTPRLESLTVKGFRAFGAAEQTLILSADIAVVWGANSKGKTSLAEAVEFLLTGRISRRELLASSQDEFADALRNAHLPVGEEVYVAARIIGTDGKPHEIRRVLTADYAKRQDCASVLQVDGVPATQGDLESYGIVLSQPPLQAPVLAQHTLSYVFSVRPQERATYFKTLLEVTDLDCVRNDIAELANELVGATEPLLAKFDSCAAEPLLQPLLAELQETVLELSTMNARIMEGAAILIEHAGEPVPDNLDRRLAALASILIERRSKTFPVRAFERGELAGWNPPTQEIWARLDSYLEERKKVDEQSRQLVALFDQALKLPAVLAISEPVDCPLCETKGSLTPERIEAIRQHVENSKEFKTAETLAKYALSQLSAMAGALASATDAALPRYLKMASAKRRDAGFTVARLVELLGDRAEELVKPWLNQVRPLARAGAALRRAGLATRALVEQQASTMATHLKPNELQVAFSQLTKLYSAFVSAIEAYRVPSADLGAALNEILDARSETSGWQDFIDVAQHPEELRELLIERAARLVVGKELDTALRQIDRAKEQVLDDKFSEFSDLIQGWWEKLRPEEPTFFSALQPRRHAKRTIDFKAGLSTDAERSAPKVRDVIAVFSQSQLHCLGLAMFLARAQHEGLGFIILDDPVLSSDEDYRVHFNSTVLTELLNLPLQVVVLTQDHDTWEELETRYRHLGVTNAQLFIESPTEGTVIENTSDVLLAKLVRARSLARGGHPDVRKQCGIWLRDAGERFCKEMLVNDRQQKGDGSASLTDFDGKTLEWLCPRVEPLLDQDPSHPGKLAVFRKTVNKACHDNTPPGNAELTQACGDMQFLVKQYLGR